VSTTKGIGGEEGVWDQEGGEERKIELFWRKMDGWELAGALS